MNINDLMIFIADTEKAHFRTKDDTGANQCAMLIWNRVRSFAGLEKLYLDDLPAYCPKCKSYHKVGTACVFSREYMIDKLVERDIESVKEGFEFQDNSFLDSVLRGKGFMPYNNLSDEQIAIEFKNLSGK